MAVKRDRPRVLHGITQRVSTGWGPVYVTVNDKPGDDGPEPFEVFIIIGKSGGLYNSMAESLAKTISNGLRTSRDPDGAARAIAEDLVGIRSKKVADDNGDQVRSIPDAVGIALLRHLEDRSDPSSVTLRGDAGAGQDGPDVGPEAL